MILELKTVSCNQGNSVFLKSIFVDSSCCFFIITRKFVFKIQISNQKLYMPVSLSVQITEDQFVNSFLASSHILYPLKKPKIFDVFMFSWIQNGVIGVKNGLIMNVACQIEGSYNLWWKSNRVCSISSVSRFTPYFLLKVNESRYKHCHNPTLSHWTISIEKNIEKR